MSTYRTAVVDGRPVLIPNDPPRGHQNPPLAALNAAYRSDDAERRDDTEAMVGTAAAAMQQSLAGTPFGRRAQKPLRAPPPGPARKA